MSHTACLMEELTKQRREEECLSSFWIINQLSLQTMCYASYALESWINGLINDFSIIYGFYKKHIFPKDNWKIGFLLDYRN